MAPAVRPLIMLMKKNFVRCSLIAFTSMLVWSFCSPAPRAEATEKGRRIVEGARKSLAARPYYDPRYVRLKYPGGDPGKSIGVCTDIVVRAYRHIGIDLQKRLHRDMRRNWRRYRTRRIYRQTKPDYNIDHRRVNNLVDFFRRHGRSLPLSIRGAHARTWKPGDIAVFDLHGNGGMTHIGIVSDKLSSSGVPLVIHHLPDYPREDNALEELKIIGHYRY